LHPPCLFHARENRQVQDASTTAHLLRHIRIGASSSSSDPPNRDLNISATRGLTSYPSPKKELVRACCVTRGLRTHGVCHNSKVEVLRGWRPDLIEQQVPRTACLYRSSDHHLHSAKPVKLWRIPLHTMERDRHTEETPRPHELFRHRLCESDQTIL